MKNRKRTCPVVIHSTEFVSNILWMIVGQPDPVEKKGQKISILEKSTGKLSFSVIFFIFPPKIKSHFFSKMSGWPRIPAFPITFLNLTSLCLTSQFLYHLRVYWWFLNENFFFERIVMLTFLYFPKNPLIPQMETFFRLVWKNR